MFSFTLGQIPVVQCFSFRPRQIENIRRRGITTFPHKHTPKKEKITSRFQVRLKNTPGSLWPCDQWPAWLWGLIIQPLSAAWHPWGLPLRGPTWPPHTPLMCLIKSEPLRHGRTGSNTHSAQTWLCSAQWKHAHCSRSEYCMRPHSHAQQFACRLQSYVASKVEIIFTFFAAMF